MTAQLADPAVLGSLLAQLRVAGYKCVEDRDFDNARAAFKKIVELEPKDINARFTYARLIDDGKHKNTAAARDMMLSILDEHPEIFDNPAPGNLDLIRQTAVRCGHVGPFSKSIELSRKLAHASNDAADYYRLSEILTQGNFLEESIASLEKAIALHPAFDTPANRETLEIAKSRSNQPATRTARKKIGRYPETKDFTGDFDRLLKEHIAVNLASEREFVRRDPRFFTMGFCFARNLASSLRDRGYSASHMEISEYINTTFANRVFVDWLSGADIDPSVRDRIVELLPAKWSREGTLDVIKNAGVFILTLGVAPAFFD